MFVAPPFWLSHQIDNTFYARHPDFEPAAYLQNPVPLLQRSHTAYPVQMFQNILSQCKSGILIGDWSKISDIAHNVRIMEAVKVDVHPALSYIKPTPQIQFWPV